LYGGGKTYKERGGVPLYWISIYLSPFITPPFPLSLLTTTTD